MDQKKRLYWLLQFSGWGGYYLLALLFVAYTSYVFTVNLVIWVTAAILFSVFLSHLLRMIILRYKLASLRFLELFLITAILVFIAALLLEAFQYFLDLFLAADFMLLPEKEFRWADFFQGTFHSIKLFGTWAFFYYVYLLKSKKEVVEVVSNR